MTTSKKLLLEQQDHSHKYKDVFKFTKIHIDTVKFQQYHVQSIRKLWKAWAVITEWSSENVETEFENWSIEVENVDLLTFAENSIFALIENICEFCTWSNITWMRFT